MEPYPPYEGDGHSLPAQQGYGPQHGYGEGQSGPGGGQPGFATAPYEYPAGDQPGPYEQPWSGYAPPESGAYPPQGYAPQGYAPQGYAQQGYSQQAPMNSMAVAALVVSVVAGPVGIPFGHMAKAQIRRTGERGSGLATAGLVLGYLALAAFVAFGSLVAYGFYQVSHTTTTAASSTPVHSGSGSSGNGTTSGGNGVSGGGSNAYSAPLGGGAAPGVGGSGAGTGAGPGAYPSLTAPTTAPSNGSWSAAYQAAAVPIPGADWQGSLSDRGARCNANDPALIIAASSASRVAVCLTEDHRYYYRGSRISDGAAIELEDPTPTSDGFLATNEGTTYDISSSGLVITTPAGAVTSSSWTQYWSSATN